MPDPWESQKMYLEATPSPQSQSSLKVPFAAQGSSHRGPGGRCWSCACSLPTALCSFLPALHGAREHCAWSGGCGGAGGSRRQVRLVFLTEAERAWAANPGSPEHGPRPRAGAPVLPTPPLASELPSHHLAPRAQSDVGFSGVLCGSRCFTGHRGLSSPRRPQVLVGG